MSSLDDPKRYMQFVVMGMLIFMTVGIIGGEIYFSGFDSEFVQGTVVPASWAVLMIAIGASFRHLGLGQSSTEQSSASAKRGPPV